MTTAPAINYVSDAARTNAEEKVAFEVIVSILKELPGGSAFDAKTIASGAYTPANNVSCDILTGEGSAADDLTTITATNVPTGRWRVLRCADAANPITIKHNTAGAGHIRTHDGLDYLLNDLKDFFVVVYNGAGGYWEELFRSPDPVRLFGRSPAAAITIASDKITPTRWMITLTGEGSAADNLSELVPTYIPDGHIVVLQGNNSHTITVKNNTGTNKLFTSDQSDVLLNNDRQRIAFQRNGSNPATATWNELWRSGFTTTGHTTSTKTTNFSTSSGDITYMCTNAITASLLALASALHSRHTFVNEDATNDLTLDPNGSETIMGLTTMIVPPGDSVTLVAGTSEWKVVS